MDYLSAYGLKSPIGDHLLGPFVADIAQLVEQLFRKQ